MNHEVLREVYSAARVYHQALAEYARKMRANADIESATQVLLGVSLNYRVALDKLARSDPDTRAFIARGGRLERLSRTLARASYHYNVMKKSRPKTRSGGLGPDW